MDKHFNKIKIDQVIYLEQCVGPKSCIFAEQMADGGFFPGTSLGTFQCGIKNERIPLEGMHEMEMPFPDFCPLHGGDIIIKKKDV